MIKKCLAIILISSLIMLGCEHVDQNNSDMEQKAILQESIVSILDKYSYPEGNQVKLEEESFAELRTLGVDEEIISSIQIRLDEVNIMARRGEVNVNQFFNENTIDKPIEGDFGIRKSNRKCGKGINKTEVKWYGITTYMDSCNADTLLLATKDALGVSVKASGLALPAFLKAIYVGGPVVWAIAALVVAHIGALFWAVNQKRGIKIFYCYFTVALFIIQPQ